MKKVLDGIIALTVVLPMTYKSYQEVFFVTMTIPQIVLPEILPVFPLTGVMLLPGTVLPLHIFEPRYRAMVEDALESDKVFGMIQPVAPQDDNRGPLPGAENIAPDLYSVGCAGLIEKCEQAPDGRYLLQLKGVNRFRLRDEMELHNGYRRIKADYGEFPDAILTEGWQCKRLDLLESLSVYGKAHGMQVKPDQAERFTDLELVNLLSVSLPFHPAEKQALLEAPGLTDRENMLMDLLRLGAGPLEEENDTPKRTLN